MVTALTPQFTMKALDGTNIQLAILAESTPMGYDIGLHEFSNGNWIGGPTMGPWYSDDINPVVASMNSMGLKAWIQANVCPWVARIVPQVYGDRVKVTSPPVPVAAATITPANFIDQVNAGLGGFQMVDGGNGLPILVAKA